MALLDYKSQVDFARRHIKTGSITECGGWRHGRAWGKMWGGVVDGYYVSCHTIGDSPLMKAGSFKVRYVGA